MINFKSEKGAALVLTLMIITLFLVFILTQSYQITNTTRQVTTMEKQIDARLIAEMGVDYYRSFVQNYIEGEGITKPDNVYITEINLPQNPVKLDSKDHKFSIQDSHIEEQTEEKVMIKFSSIGTAYNKEKEIEDTIIITFESE
ncbi:hypothetical protein [Virgibacillus litoralis]|uniref:Type II secretory pathway component PulK n=1 Tax=Virgibacillus litoralis TaxID=578221 RepID=A0ABS4HAW3_9BACI|nr:hypothetical protein [Virgibacillus litoralis]MBP1947789.1 type II secretory pathway component PulK [Virgibacillus litoralis]